ncbi:MAG: hypothetical protein COB15_13910 [Flavobacteriales bacterium]|nr:MAG: hypothetical protein COB15_13910 [Flavobacteriales bacterium]
MKYITFSLITLGILLIFSCGQAEEQEVTATEPIKEVTSQEKNTNDKNQMHFNISFQLEKVNNEHYNLIAAIDLEGGCFIISPYSPDSILLPFNLSITENNSLTTDSTLIEFPIAKEEYDSIINGQVRYVRENTTYTQKIKLNNQDDFEVAGKVTLLIEPSCVPYEIDFVISNKDGELTVIKTKTTSLL